MTITILQSEPYLTSQDQLRSTILSLNNMFSLPYVEIKMQILTNIPTLLCGKVKMISTKVACYFIEV